MAMQEILDGTGVTGSSEMNGVTSLVVESVGGPVCFAW